MFENLKLLGAVVQSERVKPLIKVVQELGLIPEESRNQILSELVSKCSHDKLTVHCEDESVDLCPHGHLFYGFADLGIAEFARNSFCHL